MYNANNGGNKLGSNSLINFENNSSELTSLGLRYNDAESITAIDTSRDEAYSAFAYSNGQIWVFYTNHKWVYCGIDKIREPVVDVQFASNNRSLYAPGHFGTLYTLEVDNFTQITDETTRDVYWNELIEKARAINLAGYNIGSHRFHLISLPLSFQMNKELLV